MPSEPDNLELEARLRKLAPMVEAMHATEGQLPPVKREQLIERIAEDTAKRRLQKDRHEELWESLTLAIAQVPQITLELRREWAKLPELLSKIPYLEFEWPHAPDRSGDSQPVKLELEGQIIEINVDREGSVFLNHGELSELLDAPDGMEKISEAVAKGKSHFERKKLERENRNIKKAKEELIHLLRLLPDPDEWRRFHIHHLHDLVNNTSDARERWEELLLSVKNADDMRCSTCLAEFERKEIKWVATHPSLNSDPLLGEGHYLRFIPTKYLVTGDVLDSMGSACTQTACPECHQILPMEWDPVPTPA